MDTTWEIKKEPYALPYENIIILEKSAGACVTFCVTNTVVTR